MKNRDINNRRELSKADEYFIEYIKNDNVTFLRLLSDEVNPWLFEIAYNFVLSEEIAEELIKETWTEFLRHRNKWNPFEKAIELEFFHLLKKNRMYWS